MIAVLPVSNYIGHLEIVEVYEYFDGPKLFVCRNLSGQLYLGLWIGSSSDSESYWLVAMTKDRFQMVRSGGFTLAEAFKLPELGFLYRCAIKFADGSTTTDVLLPDQIEGNLIPDPGEKIELPTETIPTRLRELDLDRKAVAFQREILGFHLDFGNYLREEAPARGLGKILISTQETLDSLGQSIQGLATLRGAISPEILAATEARVIQAGGGSFGLELSAAQGANLFGQSLIGEAIERFVSLIALGNEVEELRAMLIEIKPRAVSKYRDLLTALVEYQGDLKVERRSPIPEKNRTVSLDLVTAAGALKTVEQITSELGETISGLGVFVGVEIPRKTFTAVIGERTYRGKISQAALSKAEHVTLNAPYMMKIREMIEVTSSGEERLKYDLEEISEYSSSAIFPGRS